MVRILVIALVAQALPFCAAQSSPAQAASTQPAISAADTAPAFEVAVIRPNPGDTTGHSHIWSSASDGHFKAQNVTVLQLIQYAFAIPDTRITGGPAWMRSSKWDMEAKSDPALDDRLRTMPWGDARQVKQRMLQALLVERFALKTHQETHVMPIYALVVAKGGPKFGPSQINGTTINNSSNSTGDWITVQGSDHTMSLLAEQLSRTLGRVVVDETGLDGRYELTLKWTRDDTAAAGPAAASASSASGPSLFTAIQEQLGLKLKSEKGPVPILVIDHIDLPSQN